MKMTEQEFLKKYDEGYKFEDDELRKLLYVGKTVDEREGEEHRWHRDMTTIIKVGDRFFAIEWMRGLTEYQEDECLEQPYEVVREERVVEAISVCWERIKKLE